MKRFHHAYIGTIIAVNAFMIYIVEKLPVGTFLGTGA